MKSVDPVLRNIGAKTVTLLICLVSIIIDHDGASAWVMGGCVGVGALTVIILDDCRDVLRRRLGTLTDQKS